MKSIQIHRAFVLILLVCLLAPIAQAANSPTRLLRQPALSAHHLAFVYGGDIWISDSNGENARQLTTHPASESSPQFSPDGSQIAFTANYGGNSDVYVMPIQGGTPKRLTWHPAPDTVNGWSVDGKHVLFASPREVSISRSNQLFEVALSGGFPRKVMQAPAFEGMWSADGKRLAYRPYNQAYSGASGWRLHRGGTTPPVWIIDPATNSVEKIPHQNASDTNPIWVGEQVYFISDRDNVAANLFAYSLSDKTVRQITQEKTWDVRAAAAHGNAVVFEVGGAIKELNTSNGAIRELAIHISAQSAQTQTQWKDASKTITSAQLSSAGKRVLLAARGDVFSVPVQDGSTRNLTETSGVREKDALWSADGNRIAYISDQGNQHAINVEDQTGLQASKLYALGEKGYFSLLAWSPDSARIVYQDNHLNLYVLNLSDGKSTKIDSSQRRSGFNISFSKDSRWLAYSVVGKNHFGQIYIHDFNSGKSTRITDGLSHADNPAFADKDYLFFTASINSGPTQVGLDMSTQERPIRSGIYAAVLSANGKSPLTPDSGDESADKDKDEDEDKSNDKNDKQKSKTVAAVKIDFDNIGNRFVALPIAERDYDSLAVASDGALYYLERVQPGVSNEPPGSDVGATVYRFDFKEKVSSKEKKAKSLKTGVQGINLSGDGKKILLSYRNGKLEIADTGEKLEAKAIDTSGLRINVNPRQEWQQIFDETWRMQHEFFYAENMHGINWQAIYDRYVKFLPHVQRREDLNDVLVEMIAELQVGHNRVGGGDVLIETPAPVGLLGADFDIHNNRYRIQKIYQGDRWNPFLIAPMAQAGLNIQAGDYLTAINGVAMTANDNIHARLENMAGKQVTLSIATGNAASRNVVVEPVADDSALRQWNWVESNREYVDKKTNGKVAYVYLPNTGAGGFQYFNRMFFAQADRHAVIIDERRNSGGQAANYIIELLNRPYLSGWKDRDGLIFNTPGTAIYGPKVMLINHEAGSGGDFLPYAFKRTGLGKLIGTRTWGGLIGISANPNLIDGGAMVVPFFRFFTPESEWRVENEGVSPDIELELEASAVNQGIDNQLDRAIEEIMKALPAFKPIPLDQAPPLPTKLGG